MTGFKRFSDYLVEETKEVVFTFGRFNPPTVGHEKLITKVASIAKGNNYRIYASQSSDPKKNPLDYATKIALTNKYNGQKLRHGFYNFEDGVKVVSAGERDPDAEGVEGMSASKMRSAAADNDFTSFSKGLPSTFRDGKELFDSIRKGMGIKEASDYNKHIQLESVSEEREAYVQGDLFSVGDIVAIKESDEIGEIVMLGANYVIVEMEDGKKLRKWLSSVDLIESASSEIDEDWFTTIIGKYTNAKGYKVAVDILQKVIDRKKKEGTLKHDLNYYAAQIARQVSGVDIKTLAKMVNEKTRKVIQDPDIEDREGSQTKRFFTGLKKSTKIDRDREFQKRKDLDDDDPAGYEPIPGDAKSKTKPSQHTKKFKDMFGEDNFEEKSSIETTLRKKADQSGMPYSILKQVFNRGLAAWKVGHRPGATQTQWGMARVNAFATKGAKTWGKYDSDLAAKVRASKK
jgi:nicotinamide mononucleotide adenylyltransferase